MRTQKILIPLISSLVLFQACTKDQFDLDKLSNEWNPMLAVPVIHASLSVRDILANTDTSGLIAVHPETGLLSLVYKGELVSFDANKILALPDQQGDHELSYNLPEIENLKYIPRAAGKTEKVTYGFSGLGDVRLDSIQIKSGAIHFRIINTLPCEGNIKITIPWLMKSNQPCQLHIPLCGAGVASPATLDLSGYTLRLAKSAGEYNKFEIEYTLEFDDEGTISPQQKIGIHWSTTNWHFSGVYGYLGQPRVALDRDSVYVNVFNNATGAYFALTNPRVKLIIDNSFGFPVQVNFTTLQSVNEHSSVVTPIMLTGFQNPFEILAPSISEVGQSKRSVLEINNSNSNLGSLLNPAPQFFFYGMEAKGNANHPPSPFNRNFMTDKSRFTIGTELELPLEGFAYGFSITDTLDFKFGETLPKEIDSVLFRINIENRFPVDVQMQLVFLDENQQPLDSLLPLSMNYIIKSGITNSEGRVTQAAQKITDITYGTARAEKLSRAKQVVVKGATNTWEASSANPNNQSVKFYEDYSITVKVGMKVSLNL